MTKKNHRKKNKIKKPTEYGNIKSISYEKSYNIPEILEIYSNESLKATKFLYFTRLKSKQKKYIKKMETLKKFIISFKYDFIKNNLEEAANLFLKLQCNLNFVISELKMILKLKKGKFHEAWDYLVDAQEYFGMSERIGQINEINIENLRIKIKNDDIAVHEKRMTAIENFIFPTLQFMSLGIIYSGGKCSICNQNQNLCDHLEGNFYNGRFCFIVEKKPIMLDHSAMVKAPEDKRCFVTSFDHEGKHRYVMTWQHKHTKTKNNEDFLMQAVSLVSNRIEII